MTDLCPVCDSELKYYFRGDLGSTKVFKCGYMVNDDGEVLVKCKKEEP